MDLNKIQNLLNDKFDDADIDENDLESELNAILSGGTVPARTTAARQSVPKQEKTKPARRKPDPNTYKNVGGTNKPLNDPMLDISQIERMLNNFDVHNASDDEHNLDDDDDLMSELDAIVKSSNPRGPNNAPNTVVNSNSPKRQAPALPPETVNQIPEQSKVPKIVKPPAYVSAEPLLQNNQVMTPSPVIDRKSQQLAEVKQLQVEYKRAALRAKNNGDKDAALSHLKTSKQLDSIINSLNANEDVDMSTLPPKPEDVTGISSIPAAISSSSTSGAPAAPAENFELPEVTQEEATKIFNAPKEANSILEALEQRLDKFKSTQEQATAEQNTAKARRLGRIVKQYESAIKSHKGGKPVDYEDLPCPPGFPPIPVNPEPAPTVAPNRPENIPPAAVAKPKPQAPAAPQPKPAASQAAPKQQPQASTSQKPPLKRGLSTTGTKQLKYLLERQKLFREAALEAKKRGEIEQAKEYLRQAKGFDPLIEATKNGLPIDATSIPTPPQLNNDDFVILDNEMSISDSSSKRNSVFYTDDQREELFRKIEMELKDQIEMCKRNKEYFIKMGDIGTSNKFEKYATDSRKDLNMLQVRWQNGDNIPSYRTEMRTFSMVVSNHDVGINELQVDILTALDLPGKPEIDTYVRVEFPIPTEKPQVKKTKTVYNTINPEYNEFLKFEIDRKSRSLARILKRHPLKLEIFSKGGFLRSDTRLGSVLLKLGDLETKCTIHESIQLTESRKSLHSRLEFKVKLREPLLAKQIEEIKQKWIVFE